MGPPFQWTTITTLSFDALSDGDPYELTKNAGKLDRLGCNLVKVAW